VASAPFLAAADSPVIAGAWWEADVLLISGVRRGDSFCEHMRSWHWPTFYILNLNCSNIIKG
jgi:hypothetical protein